MLKNGGYDYVIYLYAKGLKMYCAINNPAMTLISEHAPAPSVTSFVTNKIYLLFC